MTFKAKDERFYETNRYKSSIPKVACTKSKITIGSLIVKESGLGERSHSVRSNPNKVKLAEKRESSLEIDDDKKDI